MIKFTLATLLSLSLVGHHMGARGLSPFAFSPQVVLDFECDTAGQVVTFEDGWYCMFVPCVCADGISKVLEFVDVWECNDGEPNGIIVGASGGLTWPHAGFTRTGIPVPGWSGVDCGWVRYEIPAGFGLPLHCAAGGNTYVKILIGATSPETLTIGALHESESLCPTPIHKYGEPIVDTGYVGAVRVWLRAPS